MTPLNLHPQPDRIPSTWGGISLKEALGVNMGSIREHKRGLWRVTFYWKGRRYDLYRDKHGEVLDTQKRATITLAFIEQKILDKSFDPAEWSITRPFLFEKACELWMKMKPINDPETRERTARNHILPYWEGRDIREIRSIHLQEFVVHLKEKRLSDKTVYNIMGELRACLRFHADSIPKLPVFPVVKVQEGTIKWLTFEDQEKVFSHIQGPHLPIFTFMRFTACRPSEARGLLRENVDREKKLVTIESVLDARGEFRRRTKTGKIRVLPIIPEIEDALRPREASRYAFSFRGMPYGKRQMERIWKVACEKAGIRINLYNGLKHSFGCQRANSGVSLEMIARIMGHGSTRTTQRYAQFTEQTLAGAMSGTNMVQVDEDCK